MDRNLTREDYEEYRGWLYRDRGKSYHPSTGRWVAICKGSNLHRSNKDDLFSAIDKRITSFDLF